MDNFASRLRKVLEHYEVTAYRVAKEVSFTNASVLNLLSGKTNPSYEFVYGLLDKYPELNANWLIMGRETMFLDPTLKPKTRVYSSPDLLASKNETIAALQENIRLKDEKISELSAALREFRAASVLLGGERENSSQEAKKGEE
jgi:transcriptional regulator with XRE-family HTH domain